MASNLFLGADEVQSVVRHSIEEPFTWDEVYRLCKIAYRRGEGEGKKEFIENLIRLVSEGR